MTYVNEALYNEKKIARKGIELITNTIYSGVYF